MENKGITLIALIITIIVLLILAGVTISMLTGENGILNRTENAKIQERISTYEERIKLATTEAHIDYKNINDSTIMLNNIKAILEKDTELKGANIQGPLSLEKGQGLIVTTKEEYVFYVYEKSNEYKGTSEEIGDIELDIELTDEDIEYVYTPSEWTNQDVNVKIVINNQEYKEYTIEYSYNGTTWQTYQEEGLTITENTTIYTRLRSTNLIVAAKSGIVEIIDKVNPEEATITLSSTETRAGTGITTIVTHIDNLSGVDITNCKWEYNTESTEIGTDVNSYINVFESNKQEITLNTDATGTYYLHVLTTDNAGNVKETISDAIIVEKAITGILAKDVEIGDYVAYDATNNYSYTSPVGSGPSHGNGYGEQTFTSSSNIKWRVLSKNETTGEIVLISESSIATDDSKVFYLKGSIGYLYAEQELNSICSIYGKGKGADTNKTFNYVIGDLVEGTSAGTITGSGARSINASDINNITTFNPESYTTVAGIKYGTNKTTTIYYPSRKTATGKSSSKMTRTDSYNSYQYNITNYIDKADILYNLISCNSTKSNTSYWLGTRMFLTGTSTLGESAWIGAYYISTLSVMYLRDENLAAPSIPAGSTTTIDLYDLTNGFKIRPIVYLKTTLKTSGQDSSGAWIIIDE